MPIGFSQIPAGPVVEGADFIGRSEETAALMRLLGSANNISVTGLPRIGKTSLVREAMRLEAADQQNGLFIYLALEKSLTNEEFFIRLQDKVWRMANGGDAPPVIATGHPYSVEHAIDNIETSMAWLQGRKTKVRFVIEEFDYAPAVLGAHISVVRERILGSHRFSNATMMTVSQNPLESLFEYEVGSDFPHLFGGQGLKLRGFCEEDLSALRSRVVERCGAITDAAWEFVLEQAGNHPFLLARWANSLIEIIRSGSSEDAEVLAKLELAKSDHVSTLKYLDQAVRRLGLGRQFASLLSELGSLDPSRALLKYRDLYLYGVLDEQGSLAIPGLRGLRAEGEVQTDVEEIELLRAQAADALGLAFRKKGEGWARLPDAKKQQLTQKSNTLRAISSICSCLIEVSSLNPGLLEVTNELMASLDYNFKECKRYVDQL